ncbi:Protein of unknown function [Gryllus bimaculatus]|nr:Protein of unknown function [Gryllus bimaculatus]
MSLVPWAGQELAALLGVTNPAAKGDCFHGLLQETVEFAVFGHFDVGLGVVLPRNSVLRARLVELSN